jgi:hypothetical protein
VGAVVVAVMLFLVFLRAAELRQEGQRPKDA